MDLSETIAPTSDQLDAVDLLTGPRTFTIEQVSKGNAEQPVNIKLAEFPRPWRPGKSMRRVLVATWGPDGASYVGRRLTLWCDPTGRFGGAEVGGGRGFQADEIGFRRGVVRAGIEFDVGAFQHGVDTGDAGSGETHLHHPEAGAFAQQMLGV